MALQGKNYAANIHGQAGRVLLDLSPLKRTKTIIKQCDTLRTNVGILPANNGRDDGNTNAQVGFDMEFGTPGFPPTYASLLQRTVRGGRQDFEFHGAPARSWLRFPLQTKLKAAVYNMGPAFWQNLILTGKGMKGALEFLGFLAEAVIQEAFDTTGWGRWKANSVRYVLWKRSAKPLIDSGQLRNAVSSEVVKK